MFYHGRGFLLPRPACAHSLEHDICHIKHMTFVTILIISMAYNEYSKGNMKWKTYLS